MDLSFVVFFALGWAGLCAKHAALFSDVEHLLLVIDNSLSMSSNETQAAIPHKAQEILRGLNPRCSVEIVSWADDVRFAAKGEARDKSLLVGVESVRALRASNDTRGLLSYVRAFRRMHPLGMCVVISDGRFHENSNLANLSSLALITSEGENLSISGIVFNATDEVANSVQVSCGNYSQSPRETTLTLKSEDATLRTIPVTLEPGENSITLSTKGLLTRSASIHLDTKDALPADNEFSFDCSHLVPKRVALVGSIPEPVLRFLDSWSPRPSRFPLEAWPQRDTDFDLVILNQPESLTANGRYLLLNPPKAMAPFQTLQESHGDCRAVFLDPLILSVGLEGQSFSLSSPNVGTLVEDGVALASVANEPVIAVVDRGQLRCAAFSFNLEDSGLVKSWLFPSLMADLFAWLTESDSSKDFSSEIDTFECDLFASLPRHTFMPFPETESNPDHSWVGFVCILISVFALLIVAWAFTVRWSTAYVLRIISAIMVLASFLNLTWKIEDRSLSVCNIQDISPSVTESKKLAAQNTRTEKTWSVAFASEPSVTSSPSTDFSSRIPNLGETTDIEAALTLGADLLPASGRRAIVLRTDGRENQGSVGSALVSMRGEKIPVFPIPIGQTESGDPRVAGIRCPKEVFQGSSYDLEIILKGRGEGVLRVMRYETPILEKRVSIADRLSVTVTEEAPESRLQRYDVILEASGDLLPQNDFASAFVEVIGTPSVTVLSDDSNSYAASVLRSAGRYTNLIGTTTADLRSLYSACMVVLEGSAQSLSPAVQESLASKVKSGRCGFFTLGSKALLSSVGTTLQDLSPVIVGSETGPLQVLLLLDKSGSMSGADESQGSYISALRTAQRIWELIPPSAFAGVLAFDAKPTLLLPIKEKATQKDPFPEKMLPPPRGGTLLGPALSKAADLFEHASERKNKLIVISDGDFADTDWSAPIKRLREKGVEVYGLYAADAPTESSSTLSAFIHSLGGSLKKTDEASIEEIFRDRIDDASQDDWIVRGIFAPRFSPDFSLLSMTDPSLPQVPAYVKNRLLERASVMFELHDGSPLLAMMPYGLGKTGALTLASDQLSWISNPSASGVLIQILDYLTPRSSGPLADIEVHTQRDEARIEIRLPAPIDTSITGFLTAPSDETVAVEFKKKDALTYNVHIPMKDVGRYAFEARCGQYSARTQWVWNGPCEYRELGPDLALLNTIARETGGKVISSEEDLFRLLETQIPSVSRVKELSGVLRLVAVAMFLAALAASRWRRTRRS